MIRLKNAAFVPVLLAALATTAVAAADEPPSDPAARAAVVQKLSDEGVTAYQARDYRKANDKFQQAYAIDPDPNLLYNIAKCFDALGDKQTALDKYELFINSPGADSNGRVKAQEAVRVLRTSMSGGAAAPAGAPAGGARGAPPPSSEPSPIPMYVAFGVGGAGLLIGSIFGFVALGKKSDLDGTCTSTRLCPPSQKDAISTLKTDSTISTVGLIVGAVGVAAGATLFVLNRRSAESGVHVSAYLGPASGGLVGSF